MSRPVYLSIVGEPEAALLSRLLGFFSQHSLSAPDLTVKREGGEMIVHFSSVDMTPPLARIVSARMASLIGVRHVDLTLPELAIDDAEPLALQAFR